MRSLRERTRRELAARDGRAAEHDSRPADDVGITDLRARDYASILRRAGKRALADQITDTAATVAYYAFLAIPALLLISVGAFSIFAGPHAVETIIDKLGSVIPAQAVALLENALRRTTQEGGGLTMILIGGAIAVWTATGAANAVMRALNRVYDTEETRGFLRQRLVGLVMVVVAVLAFVLVFGLLVLGPHVSGWIGDAVGLEAVVKWLWWTVQWPVLIIWLLLTFATVLYLGPNVDHPRWQFLSIGTGIAVVVWLLASGAFALYVGQFSSYNKAWGSLAAVIIMLTWLWISGLALLFGAEVNAESARSRELRRGDQAASTELQAPPKD